MRVDPFIRAPAMHTGLDFRGSIGEPVRATANGTVTQTGWNGGYGKMVEIDHGNGLSTRYAHLSSFDVKEGQTVRLGQTIGRVDRRGARPARICIMRRGSMAKPWIRRNSCAPASAWVPH